MKKIITLLVVLVLVLVVAPWGIGRIAEKRVNAGLDHLIEQAPYLSIVERKWTSGWFRSEQEVTFEAFGAWTRAFNPATVLAEIEKAEEGGAVAGDAEAQASQISGAPDVVEPAAEPPGAAQAEAPEATPAAIPPLRFTIRNEILHGPVLWPASLGIARVNTRLVLSADIRKTLTETFGTDEPMRVSTRVGFFGGGSTRLSGDGKTIKSKDGSDTMSYDDFKLDVGYSRNFDSYDVNGKVPRIEASKSDKSERFLLTGMTLVGEGKRVQGEIYEGDFKFAIDKLLFADADKAETTIEGIQYLGKASVDDGFMEVGAMLGSGKVRNPSLAALEFELDEVHYDFTVRRLQIDSLNKMMSAMKAAYTRPVVTAADIDAALMEPLKVHALELLKHDPEFVIDRMGIVTPQGEGFIKGVVRLHGVTAEDLKADSISWVPKVDADFTVEVAQKLVEKFPNGATGAGLAVDQGYAKHQGDKLVSHIEFKKGELKINGKAQGLPGLGGPPPEGMPPEAVAPE